MNILVTVCARAGSKGVKSKNMRDFLGVPICYYTLAAYKLFCERFAQDYGAIDLAINTDAPELYAQADASGIEYIRVERKESLAGDAVAKTDVMRDTLAEAQNMTGRKYDFVVDMDLTSPLRKVGDIKNLIDVFLKSEDAEIALSVTESRRNPYFNQLARGKDGFYTIAIQSDYVARQQAPEIFDANASLYAYSIGFLTGPYKILARAKLVCSVMEDTAVLDIDCERDYELMQLLARYFYDKDEAFGEIETEARSLAKGLKR